MASSLYDDLDVLDGTPLDNTESGASAPLVGLRVAQNWNSGDSNSLALYGPGSTNANANTSLKFMQSHMAAKRAQGRRHGSDASGNQWSSRPSIAPVVDLKQRHPAQADGSYRFNQQTGRLERINRTSGVSTPGLTNGSLLFGEPNLSLGVPDEYNPLVPNDYEELARQKRERRRAEEAALAASMHRGEHGDSSGMCRRPDLSDDEENEEEEDGNEPTAASGARRRRPPPPPFKGAAIAPPSVLLEDTTIEPGSTESGEPEPSSATSLFGINAVAAKMMARMGYREGQGLGRESQGMSTALVVEKTSRRGGKIIHERDQQRQQPTVPNASSTFPVDTSAEETITNLPLPENRSCVILLRNMCGPGEVDDDLEPETAEECAKYGKVVSCMIFELPDSPDDEAVRIFVEFESDDAATKAVLDLNGRFFAGRVVKAGFYDADKFRNLELNEQPITA
ncbi:Splicing factor [Fasciolopsis buskii]|uniref:Splicing factor 45 n=1 Tax=Fasciolopsis buskii TaxID=27845 RepID=A0A8E0VJB8_9TREM|nr:Splicing factor [Fasciolopsis buski]